MCNTEAIIRHALQEGVKITLVVNKIDRLILELRIKPADAYYKIKHTIEEINTFIRCGVMPEDCRFLVLTAHFSAASTQTLRCGLVPRTAMSHLRAPTCTGVSLYVHLPRCMRIHTVRGYTTNTALCEPSD